MINENINPFTTLDTTTIYDNNWISVKHSNIITPANTKGIYGTVHFKNYAIGIVPIDENGNTYLVGQYRYALNEYSWEIPEGGGKLNDDILVSAQRELQEEVGLIAKNWREIARLNTSNSVTDELGIIFVATNLTQTEAQPEDTEELQIKKIPLTAAFEMAMNGQIKDAITLIALMKLKLLIDTNQLIF
ncbi:MAG: NUDIX hydrolase [Chitinophagales bacterium]|nr:NUDIX hydrolase [Chitinophagales bacterium]